MPNAMSPSLSELMLALTPFTALIAEVESERRLRIASALVAVLAHHLDVEAMVLPKGAQAVDVLGARLAEAVDQALETDLDLESRLLVLGQVSHVIGKLDGRAYRELSAIEL